MMPPTRWGLNAFRGEANAHLHVVKLEILCNRECHRIFKSAKIIFGKVWFCPDVFPPGGIPVTTKVWLKMEAMRRSGTTCCAQVPRWYDIIKEYTTDEKNMSGWFVEGGVLRLFELEKSFSCFWSSGETKSALSPGRSEQQNDAL